MNVKITMIYKIKYCFLNKYLVNHVYDILLVADTIVNDFFPSLSDFLLIQLCEIYRLKPLGNETSIPCFCCALPEHSPDQDFKTYLPYEDSKLYVVSKVFEFHFQRKRVSLYHKRMDLN